MKERNDMSETKMVDVDGNELAVGDRVRIAPQPAWLWEGLVVGEGSLGRIQVEISGCVSSVAKAFVIKLSDGDAV